MKCRRGDVVLVDFPFSDVTGSKVRPALVVQADRLNQQLDDTILGLITSSRRRVVGSPTQVLVDISTPDGKLTGLRLDSIVQCENLVTRDQFLILRSRIVFCICNAKRRRCIESHIRSHIIDAGRVHS